MNGFIEYIVDIINQMEIKMSIQSRFIPQDFRFQDFTILLLKGRLGYTYY